MSHPTGPEHPIQCILPPHMLQNIAEHGTSDQRRWAVATLAVSEQFRGQRNASAQFPALAFRAVAAGRQRTIFHADNQTNLPGRVVRSEGDEPTGDAAVDEAYDGSGATYDLFKEVYERNSIDNRGLPLRSSVHYGQGYDNAFWNGQQMVYGDGDEDLPEEDRLFNRFTSAIDIVGHELTHGVTQYEAKLVYYEQSGAMNESMSDVFGSLVKQRQLNQTALEADWIIGKGLFTGRVNGEGIRSMKAPGTAYDDPTLGKDPQPAHMSDYKNIDYDNGGVHINSGIPNHAFYVVARELGGFAWEKAGHIWYVALRDKLQAKSNFQDSANLTFMVAGQLYGAGSIEQQAVRTGWQEVGITASSGDGTTETPGLEGCREMLIRMLGGSR